LGVEVEVEIDGEIEVASEVIEKYIFLSIFFPFYLIRLKELIIIKLRS